MFRDCGLDNSGAHCSWIIIASRPFQWTELGNCIFFKRKINHDLIVIVLLHI